MRNHVAAEIVTSNSFDLLPSQNDSVGVIEINDENTTSKRMHVINLINKIAQMNVIVFMGKIGQLKMLSIKA